MAPGGAGWKLGIDRDYITPVIQGVDDRCEEGLN